GEGIEGLVHISEMSQHHVDLPEQVVTPGEELWVKIIDLDLQRRRISLSIKQAAEGGEVAEEYREHFGEHAYDEEGNYIGGETDPAVEQAWAEYYEQYPEARPEGLAPEAPAADAGETADAPAAEAPAAEVTEAAPAAEAEAPAVEAPAAEAVADEAPVAEGAADEAPEA
ncbi:MAG: rpsA, partial [Actinomycetia bacterium]|nr:rpsA [Actinomycetes bacterium]